MRATYNANAKGCCPFRDFPSIILFINFRIEQLKNQWKIVNEKWQINHYVA